MSVSGVKKQMHKASQLLNERLLGAEGTKMDDDFLKMEKSITVITSLLAELLTRTTEFLQPNPAYRARLSMLNNVSRIRGQARPLGYPQTESMLGRCMKHYSQQLGAASEFGGALDGTGEALQQVSQARDALDFNIKRTFIDPLQELQSTQLKEIRHQLKKLNGRRLDFDYLRRRRAKVPVEDVHKAWDKFTSSKELVERSMLLLLQDDVHQLRPLAALVAALLQFHQHAHRVLLGLHGNLQARLTAASHKPEQRFRPRKVRAELNSAVRTHRPPSVTPSPPSGGSSMEQRPHPDSPVSTYDGGPVLGRPCCRAMYSFHPSHEGELRFSQGDLIFLTNQVDTNWYEGTLGDQSGLLPASYVDVLVPLPLP
ncbi:endophilin-A3b [Aulostomus maculatus]